jgi:hypothetical protein
VLVEVKVYLVGYAIVIKFGYFKSKFEILINQCCVRLKILLVIFDIIDMERGGLHEIKTYCFVTATLVARMRPSISYTYIGCLVVLRVMSNNSCTEHSTTEY